MRAVRMASLIFCLIALGARPAHAYLDANTGSMLVQLAVGGVAGLLVILKLFWHRILARLRISRDAPEAQAGETQSVEP